MRWRDDNVRDLSSDLLTKGYTYSVCAEDHDKFKKLVEVRGYSVQFDATVRDPENGEAQVEMGFSLLRPMDWEGGILDYLIGAIESWRRTTENEINTVIEERVVDTVPIVIESNIAISTPQVVYRGTNPAQLEEKLTRMADKMVSRGYKLHPFERL